MPLFLGEHRDVLAIPNVYLDARSLESLRLVSTQEFDLQSGIKLAHIAHWLAHIKDRFAITFQRALETAAMQKFYSVLHRFLPLRGKFTVEFAVLVCRVLIDSGKASCKRR